MSQTTSRRLTAVFLLASTAFAQGSVVVPSDAIGRDGLGLGSLAGATAPRRQQFLIGESLLTALRGHRITRLSFRRDGQPATLRSGAANLVVRLDQQAVASPWQASPVFASNLGTRVAEVFRGQVALPASPPPASRNAVGFAANEAIVIDLSQPFLYLGGTMCIDIEGEPASGQAVRAWPIDVDRDSARGIVTVDGRSCVSTPESVTRSITADAAALRPGATARFVGFAAAGEPAVLLLAAQRLASPIDLAFIGAPGCELGLMPMLDFKTVTAANRRGPLSAANLFLTLPHEARFLAARLHAQWLFVQAGNIRTSQTMTVDLANELASIDGAMVTSLPRAGAESGEVEVSVVPAVRIDWQ